MIWKRTRIMWNPAVCLSYYCTWWAGNSTTDCPKVAHSRKITKFQCISWANNPFPFGSEFAWDSTGQEEVSVHILYTQ